MSLSAEQQKLATAFPEITWSIADHICIFRPEGVLTAKTIARLISWLAEIETDCPQPFNRFTDLTKLTGFEISKLDLPNVAYWRRTTYTGPEVKSALLAHNTEGMELAHTYRSCMTGSPILVAVFANLPTAAGWLGVSPESLEDVKSK